MKQNLFFLISLSIVSIFLIYMLYCINIVLAIVYILIGIYHTKSFIYKNKIKFGNTGEDVANYIAAIVYLINWLIIKMFCERTTNKT